MLFPSLFTCIYVVPFLFVLFLSDGVFSLFVRILLPSCCVVHFFCPAPACVVCCLHVVPSCFSRCRQCCQCQLLPRGGWCGGGDRTPAVCLHSSTRPETYHPPCALRRQAYSVGSSLPHVVELSGGDSRAICVVGLLQLLFKRPVCGQNVLFIGLLLLHKFTNPPPPHSVLLCWVCECSSVVEL